jgi:hypothetical protein
MEYQKMSVLVTTGFCACATWTMQWGDVLTPKKCPRCGFLIEAVVGTEGVPLPPRRVEYWVPGSQFTFSPMPVP